MTSRIINAETAGPITLDLTQNTGRINITIDPLAKTAQATISTTADSGTSANAVNDTTVRQTGSRLAIRVPVPPGASGGMVIQSGGDLNISSINVGGSGRVIVNGVDVTSAVRAGGGDSSEIGTDVVLPAGSEILLSTHSARVVVRGDVKALDYGGTGGSLTAETVGELNADFTSGTVRVDAVTDRLNVNMTSGNTSVGAYSGSEGRLSMTSGNVSLAALPKASGRLSVSLTSGNATVTGAGHLNVRRRVTTGNLRIS